MLKSVTAACVVLLMLSSVGRSAEASIDDRRKAFNEAIEKIKKKYKSKPDSKKMHDALGREKVLYSRALVKAANATKDKAAADKLRSEYYPLRKEMEKHGAAGGALVIPPVTFPRRWVPVAEDGIVRLLEQGTLPKKYRIEKVLDYMNVGRMADASTMKLDGETVRLSRRQSGKDGFYAKSDTVNRDYLYAFYLHAQEELKFKLEVKCSKGDKVRAVYTNLEKVSGKGTYKAEVRPGINLIIVIFTNARKTDMKVQFTVKPGKPRKGSDAQIEIADFWAG